MAEVKGLAQLGAKMRGLSDKVNNRISGAATGAAGKVIKTRTIRNIQTNPSVDTGSLRDAVLVKKIPKSQTNLTSEHIVTFRGRGKPYNKKGQKINRAPHAHLVEFGTVHMKAEPSLRPAFDNGKEEALQAMVSKLRTGIAAATK